MVRGRQPRPEHAAKQLAGQLRLAIESSGLLPFEISKAAGLDHGIVARFIRGERDVSLASAGAIAEALRLRLAPIEARGKGRPAKTILASQETLELGESSDGGVQSAEETSKPLGVRR